MMRAGFILGALMGLCLVAGPAMSQQRSAPASFAALTKQLSPSVVNISTSQLLRRSNSRNLPQLPEGSPLDDYFRNFLERGENTPRRVQSLGSGFVVDASGIIVTNNHVIEDADEISVSFDDGTTLQATVIGRDDKTDVAVLSVKPRAPLKVARFGDSDKAQVGDWVIAIGDPFGLSSTVTAGIISARGRDINAGPYDDFIQTDAAINRGNSGGPLFNMDGEVIGINSAIYSPTGGSVGVGFAIPSNMARSIIAQLRQYREVRRGWLGVRIQQVTEDIAASLGHSRASGALVADVTPKSPAAQAGLQGGDLVLAYDGKPVADSRMLTRMVADTQIGKTVNVEFLRKGARRTVPVRIARLADDKPAARKPAQAAPKPAETKQSSRLGLGLVAMSAEHRTRYRIPPNVQGVVVTDVDEKSPAGVKNVRAGDVIVEVAQTRVTTPEQVTAKVEAELQAGRNAVLLLVSRGGQTSYIGVKVR